VVGPPIALFSGVRTLHVAELLGGSILVYGVSALTPTRAVHAGHGVVTSAELVPGQAMADDAPVSGSQLKALYLEADDGSRQFLGWRDAARGTNCSFGLAADGAWRCLPPGADAGTFFADVTCSTRLASVPRGCSTLPGFATVRDVSACPGPESRHVFALGGRFDGAIAYWLATGTCSPISTASLGYDLYAVGDEIAPSGFVQATPQVEP
jgi:hypothetical protein